MPDPDTWRVVDFDAKSVRAMSFQNALCYQTEEGASREAKIAAAQELYPFLTIWLRKVIAQGQSVSEAK